MGPLVPSELDYTYKVVSDHPRPLPFGLAAPYAHYAICFDLDYKMNYIERSVYNIFDLVRDIGGLVSGLHGLFYILVTALQF